MEKIIDTTTIVKIKINKDDIESAIRQFVCACYPELAEGYVIDVNLGAELVVANYTP